MEVRKTPFLICECKVIAKNDFCNTFGDFVMKIYVTLCADMY